MYGLSGFCYLVAYLAKIGIIAFYEIKFCIVESCRISVVESVGHAL